MKKSSLFIYIFFFTKINIIWNNFLLKKNFYSSIKFFSYTNEKLIVIINVFSNVTKKIYSSI